MPPSSIALYDTTLRDGTQREGISLSVADKLTIARALDRFGVPYIEGGWPGSNPKDAQFFQEAAGLRLEHARLAAFGSTRRAGTQCETDTNLRSLLAAGTPVVTLVGKTSVLHVERVLQTTRAENLAMIAESVAWCRRAGREVIYDAEHCIDGLALDAEYALATLRAAAFAGAHCVVLCDTNGGALPDQVRDAVAAVRDALGHVPLGIHTHNDGGLAVANAMAAVAAGCVQVQGTVNGYGERCGNMDLVPLAANVQLKLGHPCVPSLAGLRQLSRLVADVVGAPEDQHAPYVGRSAFAHKGGLHVAAIAKDANSYQHIDPRAVGNEGRVVVSELSGRSSVRAEAAALGLSLDPDAEQVVLERIKTLEARGYSFDGADGSFAMLVRRAAADYVAPFEPLDFTVWVERRGDRPVAAQATVKVRVDGDVVHTAGDGDGPVHALDRAIRMAVVPRYPELQAVQLVDYRVRIVDEHLGTAARPRVVIVSACGERRWTTVGCSENIIEASWLALWDSLELPIHDAKAHHASHAR
jgi:2-isopropylmalate synthase